MLRITALNRGGLAVYGPGSYDAKEDAAVVNGIDGETRALQIEYPSVPSSIVVESDGLGCTTPTVSGNVASATLSSLASGGEVVISATVGGVTRAVRILSLAGATAGSGETGTITVPDFSGILEAGLT